MRPLRNLRTTCITTLDRRTVLRTTLCLVIAAGLAGCTQPGVVNRLAIDPATPSTIYAGTADGGMFKSTDSGGSWQRINGGLAESLDTRSVRSLVIDPTNPSTLYYGAKPVFKTTSGGNSWTSTGQGTTLSEDEFITGLALDPSNPSILYAATASTTGGCDTVYKSTDAAANWTQSFSGSCPFGARALDITLDPSDPNKIYAWEVETFGFENGVFKSTNGGMTWSTITPPPGVFIHDLAVDPSNGATLYLGVTGGDHGVEKSMNGGASWTALNTGAFAAVSLAIDPANPANVYASGLFGAIAMTSTDGGTTWTPSSAGLPANSAIRDLVIDPSNSSVIYAATDAAGGVYKSTNAGGSWVSTALTTALPFGGGLVPPDNATFTVEEAVVKAQDKLIKDLDKCYRTAAKNLLTGKPDNLTTCVDDPAKGALAKFDKTVGKLQPPKKVVPACIDLDVRREFVFLLMRGFNNTVWCSGSTPFSDGALIPPDLATFNGEEGVAKASVKLATDLSKCSRKGVKNVLKGKPDGVSTCTDAALAKFDTAIAKLTPPNKVIPACLDTNALRANALLAPQLVNWCAF